MEASPIVAWVELAIEARIGDEGLREALGRSFVLTESCLRREDCTGRGGGAGLDERTGGRLEGDKQCFRE